MSELGGRLVSQQAGQLPVVVACENRMKRILNHDANKISYPYMFIYFIHHKNNQ